MFPCQRKKKEEKLLDVIDWHCISKVHTPDLITVNEDKKKERERVHDWHVQIWESRVCQ